MTGQGLAARVLAGARSLVPSGRRRTAARQPSVRTVADLVRDRAEAAARPDASAPAPVPARPPVDGAESDSPEPEPEAQPQPQPSAAGPAQPASPVTIVPAAVPPRHPAPPPATPPGPAPVAPAVRTQTADAALAPPWVRAALMGVDLRDPDPTAEHAAAGRALRRTFGVPRDPGPVIFAPAAALAIGTDTSAANGAPVLSWRSSVGLREAQRPTSGTAAVRFRVVRRDSGAVVGAEVTLLDGQGATVAIGIAGPDGRGTLAAPYPGAYMLVAAAPGYQPGAMALHAADRTAEVDMLLVRSASVSGTVRTNERPEPAAQITLVQDGEVVDMVATEASGCYRLDDLTGGEYAFAVAAAGCPPAVMVLVVPEESDLAYDIDLAAPSAVRG